MGELEKKVLEILRSSGEPSTPDALKAQLAQATDKEVRNALWHLVGRGDVKIVGEWEVQAASPVPKVANG